MTACLVSCRPLPIASTIAGGPAQPPIPTQSEPPVPLQVVPGGGKTPDVSPKQRDASGSGGVDQHPKQGPHHGRALGHHKHHRHHGHHGHHGRIDGAGSAQKSGHAEKAHTADKAPSKVHGKEHVSGPEQALIGATVAQKSHGPKGDVGQLGAPVKSGDAGHGPKGDVGQGSASGGGILDTIKGFLGRINWGRTLLFAGLGAAAAMVIPPLAPIGAIGGALAGVALSFLF